jgi:hypothetical protein
MLGAIVGGAIAVWALRKGRVAHPRGRGRGFVARILETLSRPFQSQS